MDRPAATDIARTESGDGHMAGAEAKSNAGAESAPCASAAGVRCQRENQHMCCGQDGNPVHNWWESISHRGRGGKKVPGYSDAACRSLSRENALEERLCSGAADLACLLLTGCTQRELIDSEKGRGSE